MVDGIAELNTTKATEHTHTHTHTEHAHEAYLHVLMHWYGIFLKFIVIIKNWSVDKIQCMYDPTVETKVMKR